MRNATGFRWKVQEWFKQQGSQSPDNKDLSNDVPLPQDQGSQSVPLPQDQGSQSQDNKDLSNDVPRPQNKEHHKRRLFSPSEKKRPRLETISSSVTPHENLIKSPIGQAPKHKPSCIASNSSQSNCKEKFKQGDSRGRAIFPHSKRKLTFVTKEKEPNIEKNLEAVCKVTCASHTESPEITTGTHHVASQEPIVVCDLEVSSSLQLNGGKVIYEEPLAASSIHCQQVDDQVSGLNSLLSRHSVAVGLGSDNAVPSDVYHQPVQASSTHNDTPARDGANAAPEDNSHQHEMSSPVKDSSTQVENSSQYLSVTAYDAIFNPEENTQVTKSPEQMPHQPVSISLNSGEPISTIPTNNIFTTENESGQPTSPLLPHMLDSEEIPAPPSLSTTPTHGGTTPQDDQDGHSSEPATSSTTPGQDSTQRKKTRTRGSQQSSPVRKRTRNPAMWKSTIRKLAKNSGNEYISAKNKIVEAVKMRSPCACKFDCIHRFSQENRQKVFDTFWSLGDHERQWDFIRRHSKVAASQNRKHIEEHAVKRKVSRSYFFVVDGIEIKVCKFMFMSTLSIWDSWIDSAHKHLNPEKGNTVLPDKRGRQKHHPVEVSPAKMCSVMEHANLFPRVPSHYCRLRSRREYLEHGLSLSKMARLYVEWAASKNLPPSSVATQRQYRDIVNSKLNIGFFKPKKDQCNLCCIMRNKNNNRQVREKYKNVWVAHLKNKKKARELKQKDKAEAIKDQSIAVCSFDLQKQLSCPKSESSSFYYKTKLKVLNFTVFNMVRRMGRCYLWHEGIGKKGSDEVASALYNHIQMLVNIGYKDLRFYSDNCAGQNKNRFLYAMYIWAAVNFNIKITHRYLEPGHTQMEADSIHARIEKASQGKEIFDFEGWVKEIEEAKMEFPRYEVVKLIRSRIFTFKKLVQIQNWEKSLAGHKITWSKVREVTVNGLEGNLLRIKYDLEGNLVTMSTNTVGRPVNLKTYCPPLAYDSNIPLSANTVKDLTWMCDNHAIPVNKQKFMRDLIAGVDPVEEEEITDPEYESDEELCAGDQETDNLREHEGEEEDVGHAAMPNNEDEEEANSERADDPPSDDEVLSTV